MRKKVDYSDVKELAKSDLTVNGQAEEYPPFYSDPTQYGQCTMGSMEDLNEAKSLKVRLFLVLL